MENVTTDTEKMTAKEKIALGVFATAFAFIITFGSLHFTKKFIKATKKHDEKINETTMDDTEDTPQDHTKPPAHNSLPSVRLDSSFPLKVGDKGDVILRLQTALIKSFGTGIFKKFGADGKFGNELDAFLRSKNYSVPLSQADYITLTQEKKEEKQTLSPLKTFNPGAIADAITNSIFAKDFNTSITLLKGLNNAKNYSLVSEQLLKHHRINFVRQTLVNAVLNNFTEPLQKLVIQEVLKKIGLQYVNGKWQV